jgi:hypothetical protein
VIRATDVPVRPVGPARPAAAGRPPGSGRPAGAGRPPGSGRPAAPGPPAPSDVFVYREPDPAAEARQQQDAAYWYDLPVEEREPAAPPVQEVRGPFEPLVSSSDPPPARAPDPSAVTESAADGMTDGNTEREAEDAAPGRARKLEQIKDFYLTAEAIGEDNVGKHFDELLAQQRALISDYFSRKSSPGDAGVATEHPGPG